MVVDLMCGTASVAEALRVSGYRVIASDMMTYATHHARVRLLLDSAPRFARLKLGGYFGVLDALQSLRPRKGSFYKEYSPEGTPTEDVPPRQYFSAQNAALIDAINLRINEWYADGLLSENENSLLRHDLVLAANGVANIAGTYGHFRSKWSNGSLGKLQIAPTQFISGCRTDHQVLQGRAEDVSKKIKANLCYIDPPYMKRQYAANYHIIETLARGDAPEAIGKSGLRPWRDQYSNFCTKTKITDSFDTIFSEMACDKFVISYSEDGLLSKQQMLKLLGKHGSVEVHELDFNRFRSNQSPLSKELTEYVFILEKKSC